MSKILNQLMKRHTTTDSKWINENIYTSDELTSYILEYKSLFLTEFYEDFVNSGRTDIDFDMLKNLNIQNDMGIETYLTETEGKIGKDLLDDLKSFVNEGGNCKDKSILSVILADIITDTVNKDNKNIDDLWSMFISFIQEDSTINKYTTLDDVLVETFEILESHKDVEKIEDYFIKNFNESQKDIEIWFDFSSDFNPAELEDNGLAITNDTDLLNSLSDIENYPAVFEYIQKTYLQETEPTTNGYCETEDEAQLKTLAIVLKIIKEQKLNNKEFDKDNNIGYNLSRKYDLTLKALIQSGQTPNTIKAMITKANNIASYSILGKDPKKTSEFGYWVKKLDSFIEFCDYVMDNIELHKVDIQDYIRDLGVVKKGAQIEKEDTQLIIEKIEKLQSQAMRLRYALTTKDQDVLELVKANKRIADGAAIAEELKYYAFLKKQDGFKIKAISDNPVKFKFLSFVKTIASKRPKSKQLNKVDENKAQTQEYANNDSTQLTIEGLDSLIPPQTDKDDSHASEIE